MKNLLKNKYERNFSKENLSKYRRFKIIGIRLIKLVNAWYSESVSEWESASVR
jgi:hypothetical protein